MVNRGSQSDVQRREVGAAVECETPSVSALNEAGRSWLRSSNMYKPVTLKPVPLRWRCDKLSFLSYSFPPSFLNFRKVIMRYTSSSLTTLMPRMTWSEWLHGEAQIPFQMLGIKPA